MDTLIGRTLSHYRIVEKIGAGGMGAVYRARDTRLGREVAIKVLPPGLTPTTEARARLEREARAISGLNHPNICTLHDVGREGDTDFLVMELITGGSLRDRLSRGPLSVEQVLDLGIQVADALEAAHATRIVHRDLKPGNILLTERGQVKVMDFGLATGIRRGTGAPGVSSAAITVTGEMHLTSPGHVVGTVAYMSPEQARGEEVDARSDIFALGSVLYEMASGHPAFPGDATAVIFDGILNRAPRPLVTWDPTLPPQLDAIIGKALEKDPGLRYQAAGDLRADLRRLRRDLESARVRGVVGRETPVGPRPKRVLSRRAAIAGAAMVLVAVVAIAILRRGAPPTPVGPPTWRQLTFDGTSTTPALSPDGTAIAYIRAQSKGPAHLVVQDIDGGRAIEVSRLREAAAAQGIDLRWSPAGGEILFSGTMDSTYVSGLLPRLGGVLRRFPQFRARLALSPDGATVAAGSSFEKAITLFSAAGTDTSSIRLTPRFTWLQDLDWAPDGKMLLVAVSDPPIQSVWTLRRDGTSQRKVYEDSLALACPRWAPQGGAIYCMRSRGRRMELVKIPVSADGGPSRKRPRILLSEPELRPPFAVSRDGHRLVCTRASSQSNLWWWSRGTGGTGGGAPPRALTHGTALISDVHLSPDGTRAAYVSNRSGTQNVYVLSLRDSSDVQVTFMQRDVVDYVAWSDDGQRIAFVAPDGDTLRLWTVPAAGGTPAVFKRSRVGDGGAVAWSPGREILYQAPGNRDFRVLDPVTESERPLAANDSVGWIVDARWSPDQKHVALKWNRRPDRGLWVVSTADTVQERVSSLYVAPWTWDSSGKGILALQGNAILRISYPGGDAATVLRIPVENLVGFDVLFQAVDFTPDLRSIVYAVPESRSDVWLVERFDPEVK